jgi:adenosylhomocysteine nucleosidase
MTRLGILAALPGEARTITRRHVPGGTVISLSDRLLLVLSGIGADRARVAGRLLLEHGATALVSWGSAAALTPQLQRGSIALPKAVIAADHFRIPVSIHWHERMHRCLSRSFPINTEPLVESRSVLTDPAAKCALSRRSGAIAADMESAALGRLALEAQVPFLVVRAIADAADTAVPEWVLGTLDGLGRPRPARLCAAVLRATPATFRPSPASHRVSTPPRRRWLKCSSAPAKICFFRFRSPP